MKHKCVKISTPFLHYIYRGFKIIKHGYYVPNKAVAWEGIDLVTNQADFHFYRKKDVIKAIDGSLDKKFNREEK